MVFSQLLLMIFQGKLGFILCKKNLKFFQNLKASKLVWEMKQGKPFRLPGLICKVEPNVHSIDHMYRYLYKSLYIDNYINNP